MGRHPAPYAALLLLLALTGAQGYDFLTLSSGWNPSECWKSAAGDKPCTQAPWATFGIQGLIPTNADPATAAAQWCPAPGFDPSELSQQLSANLSCWAPAFSQPNEELWQTQWEQWGSCAGFNNASDYFEFSLAAAEKYDANAALATLSSQCGGQIAVKDLLAALKSQFGKNAWVQCSRQYPDQLLSVDVCVTQDDNGSAEAVDCPSGRNWKLADGIKCGDNVVLPLGVTPLFCEQPVSPCNSVVALHSDCAKAVVLPSDYPTSAFKADYGVLWERINWLNPIIPFNATAIPKGTTVCVENGPPPADVPVYPEPALPNWLPPWSNVKVRNDSVYANCAANKPSAGFVNGTLCLSSNYSASPILGAVIGGGLAGACTGVCQYNPAPGDGNSAIVAWRFDNDNRCWMQVTRGVQASACPADTKADRTTQANGHLLQNQKLFSDFLSANTQGATDLQAGYAQIVADGWDNFYESNCGADDPTCDQAHEQLGRLLTDGFAANSTATALENQPADAPIIQLQDQLNATYRASDCERATATGFQAKDCLCDPSQPYLYCNAQLAKEAAATVETKLRNNVLTIDPASLKPAQFAQCVNPADSKGGQPLDATDMQALSSFVTAPNQDSPQQCCFTFSLGDSGSTASICLTPVSSVANNLKNDPITKAADYQLPSCGYQDPLGGYGPSDLEDMLAWDVDVPTKFCLQGGSTVDALNSLAPWFGSAIRAQDGSFCADNLTTGYTPLHAYSEAGLGVPADPDTGVQVSTTGYYDFKLLDVLPSTPACVSAAKSEALNDVLACADYCLLNQWAFQGIEWSVSSGSDIFGWSKSFPVLNGSQWVQPQCNNNTFFKGAPPPCPPPPPSPSPSPPPQPPSPRPPSPFPPPEPPEVGTTCASLGPANLYTCCKTKAIIGQSDATCPPMNQLCSQWPAASFQACCADKAANGIFDRTCTAPPPPAPLGSQCGSYPPANFYTCCLNKAVKNQPDPSCPPMDQQCVKWPAPSFQSCCDDKYRRGIFDFSCSAPPPPPDQGRECSSTGPANFYTCCATKDAQGEYDSSCPSMYRACNKWPPESFQACCSDKQAKFIYDPTCVPPPPPSPPSPPPSPPSPADASPPPPRLRSPPPPPPPPSPTPSKDCGSRSPDQVFKCCLGKSQSGEVDDTCPDIGSDCSAYPSQSKKACCFYKKANNLFDSSCSTQPAVCGAIQDPVQVVACCNWKKQKGILDGSCPGNSPSPSPSPSPGINSGNAASNTRSPVVAADCSTVEPRNLDQCCANKAAAGLTDPACPTPDIGGNPV